MMKSKEKMKCVTAHHDLLVFVLFKECEQQLEPSLSGAYNISLQGAKVIHMHIVSKIIR